MTETAVQMPESVALRHDGRDDLELRLVPATEGAPGADISPLLAKTGLVTYDPGFANTAACTSAITYIDGDAGILRYRGYPIEELADELVVRRGQLPAHLRRAADRRPTAAFTEHIRRHTLLHEELKRFFDGFPRDAHPMPVLSSAVSALSTFYQDCAQSVRSRPRSSSRRSGCWPSCRRSPPTPTRSRSASRYLYPDNSLGLVENFLRMTFGFPAEPYEPDPVVVRALDLLFILHADHEQNCSTSTVRLVGSSQANLFASVSAGIHALSGPLHGGANQDVLEMLEGIRASRGDVAASCSR